MTTLSINLNKIALLRNSRGRDFPRLLDFAERALALGVQGITVHPRPDQRHITRQDVFDLAAFIASRDSVEFNIEGYPSNDFMELVLEVQPTQVTLVPDLPDQLTSDHGWNVAKQEVFLDAALSRLRNAGIRSSLFLDPEPDLVEPVTRAGADRIELYTEDYASKFGSDAEQASWERYAATAARAQEFGVGVNAGHDLDLANLPRFLEIPGILEVSIGHALIVESLLDGFDQVVDRYLAITDS